MYYLVLLDLRLKLYLLVGTLSLDQQMRVDVIRSRMYSLILVINAKKNNALTKNGGPNKIYWNPSEKRKNVRNK